MRRRRVELSARAFEDLDHLYDYVALRSGRSIAFGYVERVRDFLASLGWASERGRSYDEIQPGLRIVGFERRLTIAFRVEKDRVLVLRIFGRGRNWQSELN